MAKTGGRVYQDVQPEYRWVPGDNVDLLVVDLTAFKNEAEFKKDHLRVQIDDHGHLKVIGERPLSGAGDGSTERWSRFEKVFNMSKDCIVHNIKGRIDSGLLLVTMPKSPKDKTPARAVSTPAPPAKTESRVEGALATSGTDADTSVGKKPVDGKGGTVAAAGGDEQKEEADQKAEHTVTSADAGDDGTKATATVKDEAKGKQEADTRKTPESPATAPERISSQLTPPALPPPSAEAEKPTPAVEPMHVAEERRWPGHALVNVLLAAVVLFAVLSLYLGYRCWKSPEEQAGSIRGGSSIKNQQCDAVLHRLLSITNEFQSAWEKQKKARV